MNFQTWTEWLAELDAITGGTTVELWRGIYDVLVLRVCWRRGPKSYAYQKAFTPDTLLNIPDEAQQLALKKILEAVRRMHQQHAKGEQNGNVG